MIPLRRGKENFPFIRGKSIAVPRINLVAHSRNLILRQLGQIIRGNGFRVRRPQFIAANYGIGQRKVDRLGRCALVQHVGRRRLFRR